MSRSFGWNWEQGGHVASGQQGGDGVDLDVVAEGLGVAVRHHFAGTAHFGAAGVGDEARMVALEGVEGRRIVVVAVLVGDEDEVRLREFGGVVRRLAETGDRVDLDGQAVVGDFERAVLDEGDGDLLAAGGAEGFHFVTGVGQLRGADDEALRGVRAGEQAQEGEE